MKLTFYFGDHEHCYCDDNFPFVLQKCCIIRSLLTNEVNVIDVTAVASVVRESSAESLNRVRGEVTTHASPDASSLESSEASMSDDVTLSVLSRYR